MTYPLSLLVEKGLACKSKELALPQCCKYPELWCWGEYTAIQRAAFCCVSSVCVTKGSYQARSPSGYGRNEKLLEGGFAYVRIVLKKTIEDRKSQKMKWIPSETACGKEKGGLYRELEETVVPAK